MTSAIERLPGRWPVLIGAGGLQVCLGTLYAWGFFESILTKEYRWTNSDAAWAFGIEIFCFGVSAAWGGFNLKRFGPRRLALIGASLFSASFALGALALQQGSIVGFYLGFSVIGGIGNGLGYVVPIASVGKWFAHSRGLASGAVVMCFGLGAAVMSKVLGPQFLSATHGDLVQVFLSLAVVFVVLSVPLASLLRDPPPVSAPASAANPTGSASAQTDDLPLSEYLRTTEFRLMWLVFFFNTSAGVSVISYQSSLFQEVWGVYDPSVDPAMLVSYGATMIAISSLFNGIGRMAWGLVSDRFGRIEAFRLMLGSQMVAFGLLLHTQNPWVCGALICYVLFCYGGGFSVVPAFVGTVFGERRMAAMYGAMLTAFAVSGIVGPVSLASWRDYFPDRALIDSFLTSVVLLSVGLICSFLLSNERSRPGVPAPDDIGMPEKEKAA